MRDRKVILIAAIGALCVGVFVCRISIGPLGFGFFSDNAVASLRLLAACAAAVIGAALAVSGTLLQATLRNPLASPWVLGLTSGASLGVVLVIVSGGRLGGPIGEPLGAVVGAFTALLLVYTLARRRGELDPIALLLIGVMVSVCFGALTMLAQQFLPDRGLARFSRWMLGSISEETHWGLLLAIGLITIAGVAAALLIASKLDAVSLADDEARSVGVEPSRMRSICFGIAGVLTAGTVLLAGPIGFVGLVCPHLARMMVGARHGKLIVASALIGAAFVLSADMVSVGVAMWTASSDSVISTGRIPVGIITAMIGAPVFIGMLLTGSRQKLARVGGL